MNICAKIIAVGGYLPSSVLSNRDLEKIVDTSDKWIKERVGIEERRYASSDESTTFMAKKASQDAFLKFNIDPKTIDLIIVATSTADYLMPSCAAILQYELGINDCPCFDINAACSGFVYLIDIAKKYLEQGNIKRALIVSSERLTRTLDWKDRSSCILFGDGAGAVVLEAHKNDNNQKDGIIESQLHSLGKYYNLLKIKSNLSDKIFEKSKDYNYLNMEGPQVFKHAVSYLAKLSQELLEKSNLKSSDLDFFIPHQANYRIIDAVAKKIDFPFEKIILTLKKHGNTSAASIPLALNYAFDEKIIKGNELIMSTAFGSGLVWGGFIAKLSLK